MLEIAVNTNRITQKEGASLLQRSVSRLFKKGSVDNRKKIAGIKEMN